MKNISSARKPHAIFAKDKPLNGTKRSPDIEFQQNGVIYYIDVTFVSRNPEIAYDRKMDKYKDKCGKRIIPLVISPAGEIYSESFKRIARHLPELGNYKLPRLALLAICKTHV